MKTTLAILSVVLVLSALLNGCAAKPAAAGGSTVTAAPEGSHFATYGTNRIHYVMNGRGDHVVVLIHCWSGNLGFWREQVPALQDRARLVLIDLPGHGKSDKPHTDYSLDFFAGAVLAVMGDAHVEKATLIGHSMGVPIICRVYAQAPGKVAALGSIDGMLRRPETMTPEQREEFIAPFRRPDYREYTTNFISTLFPTNSTAIRNRVLGELLQTPQYVMVSAMEGMFGAGRPDWDLHRVNVPVLSLHAANPMWTDEYKAYARSLSPLTDLRLMDGVGHWLMLEKPAEFNAILVNMLERFDLIANRPGPSPPGVSAGGSIGTVH